MHIGGRSEGDPEGRRKCGPLAERAKTDPLPLPPPSIVSWLLRLADRRIRTAAGPAAPVLLDTGGRAIFLF